MGFKELQAIFRPIPGAGHLTLLILFDLQGIWCCECKYLQILMLGQQTYDSASVLAGQLHQHLI